MMHEAYRIDDEAFVLMMSAEDSVRVAGSATRKVSAYSAV